MKAVSVPMRDQGNPLYPLPADYESLTVEDQRLSRVNACRQWLVPHNNPQRKATAFASAVHFFDTYYLYPDEEADFFPMFYDDEPLPPPLGHFAIYRLWALSRRAITIAPRGFAKSNCIRKSAILQMLTRPGYSFIYATSSHDNAAQTAQILKTQFADNSRIFDDFAPDFPGKKIKPNRGDKSFGIELMYLDNGSWFRSLSAESRQRGGRPQCYLLDDPEYDGRAGTSLSLLRSYMEQLLFKVVMPMVTRRDTSVRWLATFVSRRHYAWHAMDAEETPDGPRSRDPRFDEWSRLILKAEYKDESGVSHSCWPVMWPLTDKDKKKDETLKDAVSLEQIKRLIGSANYAAEYMAEPGQAEDQHFGVLEEKKHGWWLEEADGEDPVRSKTIINWYDKEGTKCFESLANFLSSRVKIFITCDTSYTNTKDSDYKVATLMGYDPISANLFVLDCWAGQTKESTLITKAFQMAHRWGCGSIHPEVVKQSFSLYATMKSIVNQRAVEMAGVTSLPRIVPLKVGQMDKTSKINALGFRFEHGLIKMPLRRRYDPPWSFLFNQIDEFNPDASNGGLQHDDVLDTVSMSMFIVKGRQYAPKIKQEITDVWAKIQSGITVDPETGINYVECLDPAKLTPQQVSELFNATTRDTPESSDSKV